MIDHRTCPRCRVTAPVDVALATAVCAACNHRFATERALAAEPYRPDEARWMLVLLLATFAAALGMIAVSQVAAFWVWLAGSVVTLAAGAWHARPSGRTNRSRPTASLPSAMTVLRRERPRRSLPPTS
jgi:cobalamin synthase